jgi:putative flippase GtrA
VNLKAFLSFAGVGVAGFLVDFGLLFAITTFSNISPILARLPSFLAAATITWLLNARFTFGVPANTWRSWTKYISVNSFGFALNYLIYAALVWFIDVYPLLAVAAASIIALAVNYLATSHFVFGKTDK